MRKRVSSRLPQRNRVTARGHSSSSNAAVNTSSAAAAPRRCPASPSSRPRSTRPRNRTASRVTPPAASSSAVSKAAGASAPSWRSSLSKSRPGRLGGSVRTAINSGEVDAVDSPGRDLRLPRTCTRTAPRNNNCGSSSRSPGAAVTDQLIAGMMSSCASSRPSSRAACPPLDKPPDCTIELVSRMAASNAATPRQPGSSSARATKPAAFPDRIPKLAIPRRNDPRNELEPAHSRQAAAGTFCV